MPWVAADAKRHKKGLTPAQAEKWAKIANGVLKSCKAAGGSDCEGKAVRVANSKFNENFYEERNDQMKEKSLPKGALRFEGGGNAQVKFEGEAKAPKLKMVGYSGGIIKDHWYWGNLGIDLAGMSFPKDRYPLLQNHNTDIRLAHMGKPKIVNNQLLAPEDDVVFMENEAAKAFLAESEKGFPFQASIYAKPRKIVRLEEGEERMCNGFAVKGPGAVWLESEFKEMSACVFGADSNTSAAAFSANDSEVCAFAEVDISGEVLDNTTKTEKEVKTMPLTKEQFKQENPDLYAEIVNEAKLQAKEGGTEVAAEIQTLRTEVTQLKEKNISLQKENDQRREKELKHDAEEIWKEKLAASDLPDRVYPKVRNGVDYNKFVKDQVLDTKAFGEAIDAEIKSWEGVGLKKGEVVLGEGTTEKDPAATTAKAEENQQLSNRLLAHVGQKKDKK